MPRYLIDSLEKAEQRMRENLPELDDANYGPPQRLVPGTGITFNIDYISPSKRVTYFTSKEGPRASEEAIDLDRAYRVLTGGEWTRPVKDQNELGLVALEYSRILSRSSRDSD